MTILTVSLTIAGITAEGVVDEDAEVTIDLVCSYSPGHPGCFYKRNGDPGDPPEAAEIEPSDIKLNGVTLADDHPLTRFVMAKFDDTGQFYEEVLNKIESELANQRADAMEARV